MRLRLLLVALLGLRTIGASDDDDDDDDDDEDYPPKWNRNRPADYVNPFTAGIGNKGWSQMCSAVSLDCRMPLDDRVQHNPEWWQPPQGSPKGHLRPLGHSDFLDTWDGEIDALDDLTAKRFWNDYVKPRRPLVLRGAARDHPAFSLWKDDAYIVEHFGHFKVKIEDKNEDRLTDHCGHKRHGERIVCERVERPYRETFMNISRFMRRYRRPNYDHYVISQMPDAMQEDIHVVPGTNCGSRDPLERQHMPLLQRHPWMTQVYEANVWINHNEGRNFSSSVIHYDMNQQMMCLYDGEKEWITWETESQIDHIPMWFDNYVKAHRKGYESDDSPIDPERVDLERFPLFAKARWTNTTMRAGDCMYLPAYHLHYVRSTGRNIAGMYMWSTEDEFEQASCEDVPTQTGVPLARYDIIWDFPGHADHVGFNRVKMGYTDWKRESRAKLVHRLGARSEVRWKDLLGWAAKHHRGRLRKSHLLRAWRAAGGDEQLQSTVPVSDLFSDPQRKWERLFRLTVADDIGEETQLLDTEYEGGNNAVRLLWGDIGTDDGRGDNEAAEQHGGSERRRDEL